MKRLIDAYFGQPARAAGAIVGVDGLQFSDDGNFLVMFLTRAPAGTPRLLAWNLSFPDTIPLLDYEFQDGEGLYGRAMAITPDGAFIAATADQYCLVIETYGGIVRDVVDFQASTDALAFSADANFLMSGFQAARLYHWNGTDYVQRWQVGINGRYVGQLMISPDTTYAVSCWYSSSYNRNYIRVHGMETGVSLWAYTYNLGTGLQDLPVDVDMSADGSWFAVGSWGDQGSQNGEVVVFSRWYPTPYYELDMAGSCFTLDLSADGHSLIAGGKHVHANVFGNGGDLYVVDLDLLPEEPYLLVLDDSVHYPNEICACEDTITFAIRVANIGYAYSLPIESMGVIQVVEDNSWWGFDSTLIGYQIAPGETLEVDFLYAPCVFQWPYIGGPYPAEISFWPDTTVGAVFTADVAICDAAGDPAILLPSSFILSAYPNPFNSTAAITYSLPAESDVRLVITDILGRAVETYESNAVIAGTHRYNWTPDSYSSGVYFARLESHFGVRTQKMLLLK